MDSEPKAASGSGGTSETEAETAVGRPSSVGEDEGSVETSTRASGDRYVVLEEVGRGGMGRVLRAYDPKLQREVALKEVVGELLGEEGTKRLIAEARAMAKLSHPNVVAIYDVDDLDRDHVVLVMEYIAGTTLRSWLRDGRREWQAIVERFIAAGRGLAAAHGAGLLHRDFKPANVLVRDAVIKVTDFGLAKGEGEPGSSSSGGWGSSAGSGGTLTEAGVVLGTPRYMAPEQHEPGGSSSGTASSLTPAADQYAFCVALWEALCDEPPFSGKQMAAQKREGPPAWPRTNVPRPIANAITRGLSVEATDRWPNMEALLEALAYDPTRQRRRWLMGLGSVGVLGLVVGSQSWANDARRCSGAQTQLEGVWDDARRTEARDAMVGIGAAYAQKVWERTQTELDAYASEWTQMHTDACEATAVRGEQSSEVMDLRMACLQRAKFDLDAVGSVLASADKGVVAKAHALVGGLRPLSRCADVEALQQDVEPPAPADAEAVESIRALLSGVQAQISAGRYDEAQAKLQEASSRASEVEYGPVQTELAIIRGVLLDRRGKYEDSETALREGLASAAQWRQDHAMQVAATQLIFVVGARQERLEDALRYRELAAGLAFGDPSRASGVRHMVASVLEAGGKYAEAEVEQRAALEVDLELFGPDHLEVAVSRNNLANILNGAGKIEESEAEYRRAVEIKERVLGPQHPSVASSRMNFGNALKDLGNFEEAEVQLREALAVFGEALGADHDATAMARGNLASVLDLQGKREEAEAEHRAAVAGLEKALGANHPATATARSSLAVTLMQRGNYEASAHEHRRALEARKAIYGPDHPKVAKSHANLGITLHELQEYEEAEAEFRRALAIQAKTLDKAHPSVATTQSNLAESLLERGKYVDAVAIAERAWEARQQQDDVSAANRAATAFTLAQALWEQPGGRERALSLAQQSLILFREAGDGFTERVELVNDWLDSRTTSD